MEIDKQTRTFALIGILSVITFGCVHRAEKEIERKVAVQSPVSNVQEFSDESDKIINEADNISDAQRAKLVVLRRETLYKIEQKDQEEMRLRLVLLKEILKNDDKQIEVNLMKQKIKKLNKEKYNILMSAMKESNRILGKSYDDKDNFDFDHTIREHEIR